MSGQPYSTYSDDSCQTDHRGVPAKEIRKRFSPEVIKRLLELKWWNWPVEKIRESIYNIQSGNIEVL